MKIEKHVSKQLAKVIKDPEKGKYAEYVMLVLEGKLKKGEIIRGIWPERWDRAIERSNGNNSVVGANIVKEVRLIERQKICKELFEQSHKTWWIQFLEKKNALYENLYDMALDSSIIPRDRIAASKVMLEHMPSFNEDINVKVEIKQTKEDFVSQLRNMQLSLHKQAMVNIEDVEIVEVIDNESKK